MNATAAIKAKDVLAEVMGLYNREITELESRLWIGMIDQFGDEPVIKFLINHAQTSVFAPKPAELIKSLRPGYNNAGCALMELVSEVARTGPYLSPTFKDQALAGTVVLLGGWVKVNSELPEPTTKFEWESYAKRFDFAYQQSCADMMLGKGYSKRLLGLHEIQNQKLKLLGHDKSIDAGAIETSSVIDSSDQTSGACQP